MKAALSGFFCANNLLLIGLDASCKLTLLAMMLFLKLSDFSLSHYSPSPLAGEGRGEGGLTGHIGNTIEGVTRCCLWYRRDDCLG